MHLGVDHHARDAGHHIYNALCLELGLIGVNASVFSVSFCLIFYSFRVSSLSPLGSNEFVRDDGHEHKRAEPLVGREALLQVDGVVQLGRVDLPREVAGTTE